MSNNITPLNFAQLRLGVFLDDDAPTLAVAVSGGADSLCLTLLCNDWCQSNGGKVIALTIDHDLRTESASEAAQVKQWLAQHHIEHHTLVWEGAKPSTKIQKTAREARYQLLTDWCKGHGISYLLTGHHRLDQWETFFQRLSKGSGPAGLKGISPITHRNSIKILRPLLPFTPEQIVETLKNYDQGYINDPSNEDPKFSRVRMRKLYELLAAEGLDMDAIERTQERLGATEAIIDGIFASSSKQYVSLDPAGYATVKREALTCDQEIQIRLLQQVFTVIGSKEYAPKRVSVVETIDKLTQKDFRKTTCGGCTISLEQDLLVVTKDPRRIEDTVSIDPGKSTTWNDLFWIQNNSEKNYTVGPLGEDGVRQLQGQGWIQRDSHIPTAAHPTLLSVWDRDKISWVPALSQETDFTPPNIRVTSQVK